jgi:DNA processing protein
MTDLGEHAALIVLLRTGERPWQQYAQLVEEAGSARAVLEGEAGAGADEQGSLFTTATDDATGWPDSVPRARETQIAGAAAQIARWSAQGMRLLTVLDSDYPANLRGVHDRPPVLFVAGRLLSDDARSVAVIGARKASPAGLAAASAIARHLAELRFTVVSGLAAGIDTAAHTAALAGGGRTVAVIGTGLRRVYPPENAPLQRQIIKQGAVISQFWPDSPPSRHSFPMRNAVMSGMTLASVVVEAAATSGARTQARLALAHGRRVFLLRSLLHQRWAQELATRPGAHVVASPQEISKAIERLTSGALSP